MRKRVWTEARLATLKDRWEAGMSATDLAKLYPEHTWRALETQAMKAGAIRPKRTSLLRNQMLRHLGSVEGATIVEIATSVAASTDRVRSIMASLHRDETVHIAGYHRAAAIYCLGRGEDISRKAWSPKNKKNGLSSVKRSESHIRRIVHTDGLVKALTIEPNGDADRPSRAPLISAFFGKQVPR
ncbi:hypothetical protein [Pandoraea sp. CB10b_02]|uniref:hypothetical protein n=1 Tax=Pandoraea sp. CB10b_02 TaxID=2014535 RepID=UPI00257F2C47|nr:hypothetical protein [Pandoraea sp. CB10b_02]